jgi:hypothetical protein
MNTVVLSPHNNFSCTITEEKNGEEVSNIPESGKKNFRLFHFFPLSFDFQFSDSTRCMKSNSHFLFFLFQKAVKIRLMSLSLMVNDYLIFPFYPHFTASRFLIVFFSPWQNFCFIF